MEQRQKQAALLLSAGQRKIRERTKKKIRAGVWGRVLLLS
jgi:hypothetical protein